MENVKALFTTESIVIPLVFARVLISSFAPSPFKSPTSMFTSCVLTSFTCGLIDLQVVLHACATFAACVTF